MPSAEVQREIPTVPPPAPPPQPGNDIPTLRGRDCTPDQIFLICGQNSLSTSSSTSSSSLRTPIKQESHSSSSSSSSSPSSPTVGEISVREREDAPNSDISPVPVFELVDDRTGDLWKTKPTKYLNLKKGPRSNGETCVMILRFRNGCKNSGRIWWMTKFHYREALTPVS